MFHQVVKDVNDVRRLLSDGRHDFYALHRAYVSLRDNANRDVLLAIIRKVNVRRSKFFLGLMTGEQTDASLDELMEVVGAKLAQAPPASLVTSQHLSLPTASPAHSRLTPFSLSTPSPLAFPSPPMSPRV